jgi:hypothetical protein
MTDFRPCSQDIGPRAASTSGVKPVARLAWLIVAYNIAIILWGAYVRVSGSGAGCGSRWPLCNGEILPSGTQSQTLIEFVHRVTSTLSLVIVSFLVVWCRRRTPKGDSARYSSVCGLFFLFNEALLGALLVLSDHVGLDPSAAHALFLCFHFDNTLLLLAALTLTARWLSNRERRFVVALESSGEARLVGLKARPWGHLNGADRSRPYERHLLGAGLATDDASACGRAVLDLARTCLSRVVACRATVEWSCPRTDERGHSGCVEAYAAYPVVVYENL